MRIYHKYILYHNIPGWNVPLISKSDHSELVKFLSNSIQDILQLHINPCRFTKFGLWIVYLMSRQWLKGKQRCGVHKLKKRHNWFPPCSFPRTLLTFSSLIKTDRYPGSRSLNTLQTLHLRAISGSLMCVKLSSPIRFTPASWAFNSILRL